MSDPDDQPVEYPIDGILDLHQFSPKETREVVASYIEACLEREIFQLRIIHGKGIGVQREIVHSLLEKHPRVVSFRLDPGASSWGATLVDLKR